MTREIEELHSELFEAAAIARRLGEQIAAAAGQTQSRWQTMWTIDAGGELTVPQIARRLGMSRQNEQRVVNELVEEGLVVLAPNPDHKTSPLVRLTRRGQEALATINRSATASNQAILDDMTAARVARLRKLLREFTAAARTQHDA